MQGCRNADHVREVVHIVNSTIPQSRKLYPEATCCIFNPKFANSKQRLQNMRPTSASKSNLIWVSWWEVWEWSNLTTRKGNHVSLVHPVVLPWRDWFWTLLGNIWRKIRSRKFKNTEIHFGEATEYPTGQVLKQRRARLLPHPRVLQNYHHVKLQIV